MKRTVLFLIGLGLFFLPSTLLSQELAGETPQTPNTPSAKGALERSKLASVFIETEPAGTYIRINDDFVRETSPAFLVNQAPGEYLLDIWKDGYLPVQKTIKLLPGEVKVVKIQLERTFTPTSFPLDNEIILNGHLEKASSTQFLLPHGRYSLDVLEGKTRVTPVFSQENSWLLSAIGLGVTALGAGAATYYDLNNPWSAKVPISPPTVGIYSLFLGDLSWFISLSLLKWDFEKNISTVTAPTKFAPASVETLMSMGEQAMLEGQFDLAADHFQDILDYYPESTQVAEALLRLGRVHTIYGRLAQAELDYRLIIQEYPLSTIWDRAQKALADLALAQGDTEKALFHLSKIVFIDPLITQEDVNNSREDILMRRGTVK